MKRYQIIVAIALIISVLVVPVFGQQESKASDKATNQGQRRPQALTSEERARLRQEQQQISERRRQWFGGDLRERSEFRYQRIRREEQLKSLETQIAQIKAEHEELIGPLEEIHKLALKEKATDTARRLNELINQRQKILDDRLQNLQQKHQRLQKAMGEREARKREIDATGKKAMDFTLKGFDGRTIKLSDFKGKIVVLEWFNFECPFSLYHYETANTMVGLANKYKDQNVVWLAINSTNHTKPEENNAFARKYKLPYPILDDRSGEVGKAYGSRTTPHMFIINKNGTIVYEGAIDNSPLGRSKQGVLNYVDRALAELTSASPVSIAKTTPYGCSVKYAPEK